MAGFRERPGRSVWWERRGRGIVQHILGNDCLSSFLKRSPGQAISWGF